MRENKEWDEECRYDVYGEGNHQLRRQSSAYQNSEATRGEKHAHSDCRDKIGKAVYIPSNEISSARRAFMDGRGKWNSERGSDNIPNTFWNAKSCRKQVEGIPGKDKSDAYKPPCMREREPTQTDRVCERPK